MQHIASYILSMYQYLHLLLQVDYMKYSISAAPEEFFLTKNASPIKPQSYYTDWFRVRWELA